MQKIIKTEKIPIKLWLNNIEPGALDQAKNLANLPFAFHHIALMPDAHQGYGMPIGGVMASQEMILPNAVGVDIGCGVCAVKTSLQEIDKKTLKEILSLIRERIPLGHRHHGSKQPMPESISDTVGIVTKREEERIPYQLGTLGGGNHFIEIQKCDDGYLYIMLHSGSRNLGKQVAEYYNNIAKELNKKEEYKLS